MIRNAWRSLWDEPRPPLPTTRPWWDWALVAFGVLMALLEGLLIRENLAWQPASTVLCVGLVFTLFWRRIHPLAMLVVAFGAHQAVDLLAISRGVEWDGLYVTVLLLVLPYSLLRWGTGREIVFGSSFLVMGYSLITLSDFPGVGDAVGGGVFLMFPAVVGASVRFRAIAHLREFDQVKLLEREQLARELHDTVAHHISAIAIQAQAGRTLAASDPNAAVNALDVIEEAAARTLTDLRDMVRALRHENEAADLAPQPGVANIERLTQFSGDRLPVHVELSGDLEDLKPSVDATIYRLARESITNAVRHARHATRISVRVVVDDHFVRLTVSDDGDPGAFDARTSSGFGLVGMAERATLLGGTFEAGPSGDQGWTVDAVLPRQGSA